MHSYSDNVAAELGFTTGVLEQAIDLSESDEFRPGERRSIALLVDDSLSLAGLEIGQTEERIVYARQLPPKA